MIREAQWKDLPGIWKVCSRHFPEYRGSSYSEFQDLFSHRWLNNPARTDEHSLGWVVEENQHIFGFIGMIPMKFQVEGEMKIAASGTSWCVDSSHRQWSFELYKKLMDWGNCHLLLDTTSGVVANQFHTHFKCGMQKLSLDGFDQRFFWILNSKQLVQWKKIPFSWAVWPLLHLRFLKHSRLQYKKSHYHIERIYRFDDAFDHLWEKQRKHFPTTVVRNMSFLNWRLCSSHAMGGKFYTFAAYKDDEIVGYIVLHERGFKNRKPGHFIVADIFFDKNLPKISESLFLHAIQFAKSKNGMVVEMTGFHPSVMKAFKSFLPWIRKAESWTYWYKGQVQSDWWPSQVDGDLNL